ncbi:MAG: FMN-binding glutamate synthase family protein [Saprospiraceae bacterium]
MRNEFIAFSIIALLAIAGLTYFVSPNFLWWLVIIVPLVIIGGYDMVQKKHAIMRNYPIFGRGRYLMEELRPKLYQYFIESDTSGTPINRISRAVVYQRAKDVKDTTPFGTQLNVYDEGYEWMNHSIAAKDAHDLEKHPRIRVGGQACKQPYDLSLFNVSAMSYGSLSANAIAALNGGAKIGGFAHNTGEGSISSHHENGGDLIYQVGTGYFGCRSKDGNFSPELFEEISQRSYVKMIELKLSQGAKPGHGGILPAKKNNKEIAKIRNVEPNTAVHSPPYHKAFNTPIGLLKLLQQMRELSGGKPVGFKLCVGNKSEFIAICKAMLQTGIKPDFISVDGGEGGTGAAPPEFSNSVGTPYREGLAFVHDCLTGFDLRKEIKLIASGKMVTSFDIVRALALGADATYSARAMMLALGCIQALLCNQNTCPTGVTTHDPELTAGLVVSDKKVRVANYHRETIESLMELTAAAGLEHPQQFQRQHIYRRTNFNQTKRYNAIFPEMPTGALLDEQAIPTSWVGIYQEAQAESFLPKVIA